MDTNRRGNGGMRLVRARAPGVLVRAAVPPLVLVLVLAWHVSLRSSSDLTPWKGGGFGMFSTIDSPGTRLLRAELETDVGAVPVAVPSGLEEEASIARAAPTTGRLVRVAGELAQQWWVVPKLAAPGRAAPGGDEATREVAVEAPGPVAPIEAVQPIAPADFEEAHHRRLEVRRVTVAVLRVESDGFGEALRPRPIRAVSVDVGPVREEGRG